LLEERTDKEEGRRTTWREPRRSPLSPIAVIYEFEAGKGTVAVVIPHADPSFLLPLCSPHRFVLFPNPHNALSIVRCY
jgi:hypothetical protein